MTVKGICQPEISITECRVTFPTCDLWERIFQERAGGSVKFGNA